MSADALARSRRILWIGLAIQVLGIAWDALWHRRNPGSLETGWTLLEAHGIGYVGLLVVGAGALYAFARADPRPGPLGWYALAGYGALGQLIGTAWDALAHAAGREVALAHLMSRFGLLLVVAALVLATLAAREDQGPG